MEHHFFEKRIIRPCKKQGPAREQMIKISGPTSWEKTTKESYFFVSFFG